MTRVSDGQISFVKVTNWFNMIDMAKNNFREVDIDIIIEIINGDTKKKVLKK